MTLETSTVKADLSMIESVEVVDPTTCAIHLNRPDSSLLQILADRPGMMVSPTAAADPEALGSHPVGTGPYTFVEWIPGDRLVATKNAEYWQEGLPHLDRSRSATSTDQQTGLNALTAGEADFHLRVRPESVDSSSRSTGSTWCRRRRCGSRTATSTSRKPAVRRRPRPPGREPGDRPRGDQRGATRSAWASRPCRSSRPGTGPTSRTSQDDVSRSTRSRPASCSPTAGYADGVSIKAHRRLGVARRR